MNATHVKSLFVATMATLVFTCHASAVTLTPTSAGLGWDREDAGTTYMEWDVFTDPFGGLGNLPDVDDFNGSTALVTSNEPAAFLTSGGNIYSFSTPTDFTVDFPIASGSFTRVMVQFRTQGTELDQSSLLLNGDVPTYTEELGSVSLGGFGGEAVDFLAIWDLTGASGPLTLDFEASGSSMSLDRLVIDTGSQVTAFQAISGPFATSVVPEPKTMVMGIFGVLAIVGLMATRKFRRQRGE